MTIDLSTGTGEASTPGLSLVNEGDIVNFVVVDIDHDVPVYKYGVEPKTPELNYKGQPKKQIRLTVLALKGNGVTGNMSDGYTPLEPDSVYSIYISGYAKWDPDQDKLGGSHISWSAAVEKLGALRVGTFGQWKHLGTLPSKGAEPRKNRKFSLRPAKPEEAEIVARCEALHQQMKQGTPLPAGGPADEIEEPF